MSAAADKVSYEIRIRRAGLWEISQIIDDPLALLPPSGRDHATPVDIRRAEEAVRERARRLLAAGGNEAVTVTRSRGRDMATELVVFSEERDVRSLSPRVLVTLGTVDGAVETCRSIADLCRREAYHTAGLLLRSFLEKAGITAFELFHSPAHQQSLIELGGVLPGAIERAAKLQAGEPAAIANRKAALDGLVRGLSALTGQVAALRLPTLSDGDFGGMADAALALGPPETASFRVGAALTRSLARNPGMAYRIEFVMRCLTRPLEPWLRALLDLFLAGVFDDATTLARLLPSSRDRAAKIQLLTDLAEGSVTMTGLDPLTHAMALLIGRDLLPHTRQSLWERIVRDLARSEPLSQFEPALEREKLAVIRARLPAIAPAGLQTRLERALYRRGEALRQAALDRRFG